jgi:S1-C subfamily serine protease
MLLVWALPSQAAQSTVLENPTRAYGYGYGYGLGDEDSTGAYLGVDITDVTPERLTALKLKDEHGVEVTIVDQDAPAGKAGIKEHDVILTMNGATIDSGAQLRRMIRETPPGRVVSFGISRDGQPVTVKVQLGDRRKNMMAHSKDFKFEMPAMPAMPDVDVPISVVVVHSSLRSGLMVENITPQLGDFFGVKSGKGVLVRSVEKGSRADKAGFRAGDVVVKVNDQPVQDTSDFSHALRSRSSGNAAFVVIRDKKEQNLSMPIPEQKESGGYFDQETFDLPSPELDANTRMQLSTVRQEMAKIQPQLQFAVEQARQEVEKRRPQIEKAQRLAEEEVKKHQPEIDRALAASIAAAAEVEQQYCAHQKEIQEQLKKSQDQLKRQMEKMKVPQKQLEQNRKQFERFRHEFSGEWLEI